MKVAGLDHVYAPPGINLSGYTKVMLDLVEVSFAKSGKPIEPVGRSLRLFPHRGPHAYLSREMEESVPNYESE